MTPHFGRCSDDRKCQRASLPARLEAGCGLGSSELRTRPADTLVTSWS